MPSISHPAWQKDLAEQLTNQLYRKLEQLGADQATFNLLGGLDYLYCVQQDPVFWQPHMASVLQTTLAALTGDA